jgi:hypothetical protein
MRQRLVRALAFASVALASLPACAVEREDRKAAAELRLDAVISPVASIQAVGIDTLGDSASIQQIRPEPDGGSVAFLFADPAKGIRDGLGLVSTTPSQAAQLAWPDSVTAFWWSGPHQLSFTAGTGQGVRVVVDAHAAELQALNTQSSQGAQPPRGPSDTAAQSARVRAQTFIDSIRVQPGGTPQQSALHYHVDTVITAGDTLAAIHVIATDAAQATRSNPTWYLAHLPTGHVHPIDSLTGQSSGLPATAGAWGPEGIFYYAKERSIWRAQAQIGRR